MPLVIGPLAFVLHAIGAFADAEAIALIVLPLAHVGFCGGGIHVVFHRAKITVNVTEADGGVGITGTDSAHGCIAADGAALAGDGRLGFGLAQFHAAKQGAPSEEATLLLAQFCVRVEVKHEATSGASRVVCSSSGSIVKDTTIALLAPQ